MSRNLLKVGDVRHFVTEYDDFIAMVYFVDERRGKYDLVSFLPGFVGCNKCSVPMNIINKQVQLSPEIRDAYNNARDLLLRKRNIREQMTKLSNELVEVESNMIKYGISNLD